MFELDLTGLFLCSAELASNQLASCRIDRDNGALEPLGLCPVGQGLWWV